MQCVYKDMCTWFTSIPLDVSSSNHSQSQCILGYLEIIYSMIDYTPKYYNKHLVSSLGSVLFPRNDFLKSRSMSEQPDYVVSLIYMYDR